MISYYHGDGLGSVTSLTNGAGALVATYTYDAFGNIVNSAGNIVNPFRYTGREWDGENGLYYYRARYYDPQIGRFASEDPIRISGGINLYAYVGNNPVGFGDPTGLKKSCPCNAHPTWLGLDLCKDKRWIRIEGWECTGDVDCCRDKMKEFTKKCESKNDWYDKAAGVGRYEAITLPTHQYMYALCCRKW